MKFAQIKRKKGFTLQEILLAVTIMSILAGTVIIAINPAKQLGDTRNAQRQTDVTSILNGVYQYLLDNNGAIPLQITGTATEICATGAPSCKGLVDLSVLTANEKYLTAIPQDPQCSTVCGANGTGYKILKNVNNRITVSAAGAELGKTISVTR